MYYFTWEPVKWNNILPVKKCNYFFSSHRSNLLQKKRNILLLLFNNIIKTRIRLITHLKGKLSFRLNFCFISILDVITFEVVFVVYDDKRNFKWGYLLNSIWTFKNTTTNVCSRWTHGHKWSSSIIVKLKHKDPLELIKEHWH